MQPKGNPITQPNDLVSEFRIPNSEFAPLIVVSGPSGVGKTTIVERLLRQTRLPLRRAITATTRPPREGERDGIDYHYWSESAFRQAIDNSQMLEWAVVFQTDFYGTPRSEVDEYRVKGVGVILVLDVQGAARIRELLPNDHVSVFIAPPSFEELENRLRSRHDMPEQRVQRRLATAKDELVQANKFNHRIVNRDIDEAVGELERIINSQIRV